MTLPDWQYIRSEFKRIWGYDDFRPPQGEIIRCLLAQKDALVVLPTGGGKSLCFQLPALLQTGLTLVISPLVALMENQVQELHQLRLPGALLHSELPRMERREIFNQIDRQNLRILYLSPETLLSPPVWERLTNPNLKINGLILDEAHCLVQWGDTFRPAYRRLGAVRPALLQSKPKGSKIAIAAFTATANPSAQSTIIRALQLQKPQPFLNSPYRPNLHLQVRIIWTPRGRKQQTLNFIQKHPQQSGLIYLRSRRECEELAQWLTGLGYSTAPYHAGLNAQQRRQIETEWLTGKLQFVPCTSAFGMGVNKPDVRWIIHFQAPELLSEYIQEVGRGGRDGKPAQALTLISEPTGLLNPEDQQRRQFFSQKVAKDYQKALQLAKKIPDRGDIQTLSQQFPDSIMTLSLLHAANALQWLDPFHYQLIGTKNLTLNHLTATHKQASSEMQQYLTTKGCRWQFLLQSFGFEKEAIGWRCRHCDNCQKR